jgi:hypothetical protein
MREITVWDNGFEQIFVLGCFMILSFYISMSLQLDWMWSPKNESINLFDKLIKSAASQFF